MDIGNSGRQAAFRGFCETLSELRGKRGVSEIEFRDTWIGKVRSSPDLSLHGWYDPPPTGTAVLFGTDECPERIAFGSLRSPEYWCNETTVDWSRGIVYAYCSFVNVRTGIPGDFAVTLYFGDSPDVLAHFRNAYTATREVLSLIELDSTSSEVFHKSQRIFSQQGLRNSVVSVTDQVELDLGHSIPVASPDSHAGSRTLTREQCAAISRARQFINGISDWRLRDARQVTIEPQLLSLSNPALPQFSFHYVVTFGECVRILDECDKLFQELGLIK